MVRQGMEADHCPRDWMEAFFMLSLALQKADDGSRQLVFLDELPWMDTPRSFFVTALENFWNGWACHRANFMLVVCGSASSWILNKLVNNHGGLYGRLTYQIRLSPFTLGECEEYYESRGIALSRYDMVQSYMIMGGVPYYMGYMRRQKSLSQNIDDMFFTRGAQLRDEFDRLFLSVFDNPDRVKDVVVYLNSRNSGFTRDEISRHLKLSNGGALSSIINNWYASLLCDTHVSLSPHATINSDNLYFTGTDSLGAAVKIHKATYRKWNEGNWHVYDLSLNSFRHMVLDEEESRIVIQTVSELYEETYDQNLQNLLDNKAQFDFMAKMENSEGQDQ